MATSSTANPATPLHPHHKEPILHAKSVNSTPARCRNVPNIMTPTAAAAPARRCRNEHTTPARHHDEPALPVPAPRLSADQHVEADHDSSSPVEVVTGPRMDKGKGRMKDVSLSRDQQEAFKEGDTKEKRGHSRTRLLVQDPNPQGHR